MIRRIALMCLFGCLVLLPVTASAQKVVSVRCYINGAWVWLDGRSTCPTPSGPTASPGGGVSARPYGGGLQIGAELGWEIGSAMGAAIGAAIARNAAAAAAARAAEEARLAEEARQRAIEEERRREELHRRVMGALKLTGLTDLSIKGLDGRSDLHLKGLDASGVLALKSVDDPGPSSLRPKGTSLFGLGGETRPAVPEPVFDQDVVDLRNLERAVMLLKSVPEGTTADDSAVLDEALNAATGDTSVVPSLPAGSAVPMISENGLKTYQLANIEYANARDWLLHRTRLVNEAGLQREATQQRIEAAKMELDNALARRDATVEDKRGRLAELLAAIKAQDQAVNDALRRVNDARRRAEDAKNAAVRTLRFLAAGTEPPPPSELLGVAASVAWGKVVSAPDAPVSWGTPETVAALMSPRTVPLLEQAKPYLERLRDHVKERAAALAETRAEGFVVGRLAATGQVLVNIPKATEHVIGYIDAAALANANPADSRSVAHVFGHAARAEQQVVQILFNDGSPSSKLAEKVIAEGSLRQGVATHTAETVTKRVGETVTRGVNNLGAYLAGEYGAGRAGANDPEARQIAYRQAYERLTAIVVSANPEVEKAWVRVLGTPR